ncbi:MAG: tetratricopeptide repeat protein, partial [Acidobacteria bacterium]|nr:tetratricopeptide repeat protein [Acidobacteriota bacterium]
MPPDKPPLYKLAALVLCGLVRAALFAQETAPSPVDEALVQVDAGNTAAAIAILEAAAPPGPRAASLLGALYLDAGRAEDAWRILEPLAAGDGRDQAAVLYNAGRAALQTGHAEEADSLLERSVALEAGTPAARDLGILRGSAGAFDAAYELLRPWALQNQDDSAARLAAAVCALRLHRLSEAEELLSDLDQQDPEVRLTWARLLLRQQDAVGAYAMLEPLLLAEGGAGWDAKLIAADAQLAMAQPDAALALLEGRDERDPLAALQTTRALYQDGRVDEALAVVRPFADQALAIDPIDIPPRQRSMAGRMSLEMGRILAAQGEYAEALPFLKRATLMVADEAEGWRLLGRALAATERSDDAAAALAEYQVLARRVAERRETLKLDPVAQAMAQARALVAQERPDEALALVRREAGFNPNDPRSRVLEGGILLSLGRTQEAAAIAAVALAMTEQPSADALYLRGAIELASSRLEAAESDFRTVLELAPDHVPALNDLAVVMIRKGQPDQARDLLARVLELVPEHP